MTEARSRWGAAIAGGVIGALLTAAILLLVVPQWLAPSLVRQGLMKDPQILVDAAVGPLRRFVPEKSTVKWAVSLARRPNITSLGSEGTMGPILPRNEPPVIVLHRASTALRYSGSLM